MTDNQNMNKLTDFYERCTTTTALSLGVLSSPVVRAKSGKGSHGDVTAHGRVQED